MSSLSSFRPRAVIFDVDGTIVDNMAWHARAFEAFAARHGLPAMTLETRRKTDGKRNREIFPMLFERDLTEGEIRAFEDEKEGTYREISRAGLEPMSGLIALLDRLDSHGIAVALATSAPAANVAHTLDEIGLAERFGAIARGDQVRHGKPAPDVFLHAASLIGVDPLMCLAFEDAPLGVASARNAGMRCVAITSTFSAEALLASTPPPDAAYADFTAFLGDAGAWLLAASAQS
jgi:HAD superfamily hydrolase (TIGR01509 family)